MSNAEVDRIGELLQRARRIETKLSIVMEKIGVDPRGEKPHAYDGSIDVPSLDVSLKDILGVIPIEIAQIHGVSITHKRGIVARIWIPAT